MKRKDADEIVRRERERRARERVETDRALWVASVLRLQLWKLGVKPAA